MTREKERWIGEEDGGDRNWMSHASSSSRVGGGETEIGMEMEMGVRPLF
jgi:hypothetical protein